MFEAFPGGGVSARASSMGCRDFSFWIVATSPKNPPAARKGSGEGSPAPHYRELCVRGGANSDQLLKITVSEGFGARQVYYFKFKIEEF